MFDAPVSRSSSRAHLVRAPEATAQRRLSHLPLHRPRRLDEQTQDGVLLFEGRDGRSRLVNGNYLGIAAPRSPVAAAGNPKRDAKARTTPSDPFAGGNGSNWCARASPPSSPCRTRSPTARAIQLAHEFYDAPVRGYPVDRRASRGAQGALRRGQRHRVVRPCFYL